MNLVTVICELMSAASTATGDTKVIYLGSARSHLQKLKAKTAELEFVIDAQERELVRLAEVST